MASWTDALSGLFQGSPVSAPSYTASTTDVPKWLQDYTVDLFSQARAVSGLPYFTYPGERIAQPTAATQQAYDLTQQNIGAWQPGMTAAQTGTLNLSQAPGAAAAASPYLSQAGALDSAAAGMPYMTQAANISGVSAASPYLQQAAGMSGLSSASPYLQQAAGMSGLNAASPYFSQAGQSAVADIQSYLNPYTQNVTDRIAQLGARNLSENLLPAVSDQFIRAGQFGSSGMGEFGARALRDTQEAVLGQQAQALQQGYGQALGASQADLSRYANLGQAAGSLTAQQQQALADIGQQYGSLTAQQQQALSNIGQQYGSLSGQQQQALANIGQGISGMTDAQRQGLLALGSQAGQFTASDLARQQGALSQLADLTRTGQGLSAADAAALQSIGTQQQAQTQAGLDMAYQDFLQQRQYPQQQVAFMSDILRGLPSYATTQGQQTTGATTQFGPSPLSQLASAYFTTQALGR